LTCTERMSNTMILIFVLASVFGTLWTWIVWMSLADLQER